MTEAALIERIAARGDGVTGDGRHVAGGVPGDRVRDDGIIIPGPNRTDPVCRHFGKCGGCQLQHVAEPALADFVRDRVVGGLEGQEVTYGEVFPARLSLPQSRRRAALTAPRLGGRKSGVEGERVTVRVEIGGRRSIKKKKEGYAS